MSRAGKKDTRAERAIETFACPTCKARPTEPCSGLDARPLKSRYGPGCHPLRRKLLSTLNKIGDQPEEIKPVEPAINRPNDKWVETQKRDIVAKLQKDSVFHAVGNDLKDAMISKEVLRILCAIAEGYEPPATRFEALYRAVYSELITE